ATPAPRRAAAAEPVPDDALLRAFLDGLGMPNLTLGALDEERMRLVGLLLREATRGAIELLVARASLKREMRAQVTMIVAKENNPLKFSPSVEVALQHLLGAPVAGFMPPADALRDAFDDLRAHQLGVMAGMRAALEGVLRRFDPAVLEGRIEKRSALADLLPGSRKARLWELYQQLFSQLSEEAADEFHELFGKAFLRAYDAQIAQLRGE
ncbi:MAG: type VI secretion system-associated FHA domain protein TagH, partial [Rhizobacter sp.]